ncbi:MAG: glycosyltransferase family 2 protein [Candidatus Pedobacter colombiensis]|uniref:Glycosyltransferase family 2 protein n=1 Tax=Candidatus Pedobacter colombiensis TaxID=3121371 RepID=A0AAJ5W603_9SPHI|nr:glycosyltransferase family 2 protein [Pedobacter sp.]WEK19178.1 MAG: glycosyltransferase family 2 protein [Pedobacter sp.]
MAIKNPKISIISVNYNNQEGLARTIDSVTGQTYEHTEYIIVDGGSTDGSKEVILEHEPRISHWVSEPDRGVFHAMNKGIELATGEYLLFINSGDFLIDDRVLEDIVAQGLNADLVYGNIRLLNGSDQRDWRPERELSFKTFYDRSIPHQSTLIKRTLFSQIGCYTEQYQIVSDWEFFLLAICKYQCTYVYIDRFIAGFTEDGISSNPQNFGKMHEERHDVYNRHFSAFIKDYEKFELLEKEMKKIAFFSHARHFVKRMLKSVRLGPSV